MAARIIHRQWRDEQADSKHPFADSASLISREGAAIDKAIFLDANIYPVGGSENMYLSSIAVGSDQVVLYIGTLADAQLCSGVFDPLNPPSTVRLEDMWGRAAGVLVSDELLLAQFQSWELGTYTFDDDAAEFAAAVCVPTPEIGVRGLITEDGDLFTGDVWLTGEYGVVVREDLDESDGDKRVIRIDAVGDPLFRRLLCEGTAQSPLGPVDLFKSINYLKTINGMAPDQYGDWKITAGSNEAYDTILRIYPTPEGVKFEAVGERTVE
jgi:hypothetical protein